MTELAPGLLVTEMCPVGQAFVMEPTLTLGFAMIPEVRTYIINPRDWERIPAAKREEAIDYLTKCNAEQGIKRLELMLANL